MDLEEKGNYDIRDEYNLINDISQKNIDNLDIFWLNIQHLLINNYYKDYESETEKPPPQKREKSRKK